jgi:hypothetical protein
LVTAWRDDVKLVGATKKFVNVEWGFASCGPSCFGANAGKETSGG